MAKNSNKDKMKKELDYLESKLRKEDAALREAVEYTKKHLDEIWGYIHQTRDRLQELEIRNNLITRLLTTICVEKLGMRLGAIRRMVKQVEKDTVADSQVAHLERLFSLEAKEGHRRKKRPNKPNDKK